MSRPKLLFDGRDLPAAASDSYGHSALFRNLIEPDPPNRSATMSPALLQFAIARGFSIAPARMVLKIAEALKSVELSVIVP